MSEATLGLPLAPNARRARGPTALGGGPRRFFDLVWMLAVTEFRLSYFGSALGYLWSLMRPLMLFGVLYVVFTKVLKFGAGIPNYPVILLMNIVLFTFFAEATGMAVMSLVVRESLVRKMHFPRLVVPLSVVLTAAFNLLLNLVAVFVFVLASGVAPRASWLLLPLALVALVVYTTGVAMILSALYVRFRDVSPIWTVLTQLLFYASPIIFTVEKLREQSPTAAKVLLVNPLSDVLEQTHQWIVDPGALGAVDAAGGPLHALVPLGVLVGVVVCGLWLFNREAPRVAEEL